MDDFYPVCHKKPRVHLSLFQVSDLVYIFSGFDCTLEASCTGHIFEYHASMKEY